MPKLQAHNDLYLFPYVIVAKIKFSYYFYPSLRFRRNLYMDIFDEYSACLTLKISILWGAHINFVKKIYLWDLNEVLKFLWKYEGSEPMECRNSLPSKQLNPRKFTAKSCVNVHVYMCVQTSECKKMCVYMCAHRHIVQYFHDRKRNEGNQIKEKVLDESFSRGLFRI